MGKAMEDSARLGASLAGPWWRLALLGFVLVFAGLAMPIADARLAPMGVTARCTGTIHYGGIIVCPEPIPALPPDVWQGIAVIVLSGAMFAVGLWFLLASLPPRSREP